MLRKSDAAKLRVTYRLLMLMQAMNRKLLKATYITLKLESRYL